MASVEKHVAEVVQKFAQTSQSLIKLHRIAPLYLGLSMSEQQRELRRSPYRGSGWPAPTKTAAQNESERPYPGSLRKKTVELSHKRKKIYKYQLRRMDSVESGYKKFKIYY
jgi:hypothetical protein